MVQRISCKVPDVWHTHGNTFATAGQTITVRGEKTETHVLASDYDALKTEHDQLVIEHKKFVEKFHHRTELGNKLARVILDNNCQLADSGLKQLANVALEDWEKETGQ